MGIKQLNLQKNVPDFELPTKYSGDIWDVMEWDCYKDQPRDKRSLWRIRSSITSNKFDVTCCKNLVLREELKYCFYYLFEIKKNNIGTIAEKYDYLKHIINYLNNKEYSSLSNITDISDFERYIVYTIGNKAKTSNGKHVKTSTMEFVPAKKRNRCITFFENCIQTVIDYYEKDIPETQKDVWHCEKMPIKNLKTSGKTLDFRGIANKEFRQHAKDFCYNRLSSITWDTVSTYLLHIRRFFSWLEENHSEIKHLDKLNRDIIEEYFCWLRIEQDLGQQVVNTAILDLKVFFEYGRMLEFENFPQVDLITTRDYAFKTKKESSYFTDEEVRDIMNAVPHIKNKMYGRMLYVLMMTGMRISELLYLSVNSLKQYSDGKYFLALFQHKTLDEYEKPIDNNVAKIMLKEIEKNKKKFGDSVQYVFVNEKNKPIIYGTFCKNINGLMVEQNVKGRDGLPIKFHTHRMRATYATNLFKSGQDPKATANLMGQRDLKSLSHYVVIKSEEVKRQLKPRIDRDEILISNIGNIDDAILSDYEHAEPLCNGWCVRNSSMGQCLKANSCLSCNLFVPSPKHLANYKLQLLETESSITIAKANGLDSMVEKNMQTKKNLEDIISKIEKKMEEKDNGK